MRTATLRIIGENIVKLAGEVYQSGIGMPRMFVISNADLKPILISQWIYHSSLEPDDRVFHKLDKIGWTFVTSVKGMEKFHNVTHVTTPRNKGGEWVFKNCGYRPGMNGVHIQHSG